MTLSFEWKTGLKLLLIILGLSGTPQAAETGALQITFGEVNSLAERFHRMIVERKTEEVLDIMGGGMRGLGDSEITEEDLLQQFQRGDGVQFCALFETSCWRSALDGKPVSAVALSLRDIFERFKATVRWDLSVHYDSNPGNLWATVKYVWDESPRESGLVEYPWFEFYFHREESQWKLLRMVMIPLDRALDQDYAAQRSGIRRADPADKFLKLSIRDFDSWAIEFQKIFLDNQQDALLDLLAPEIKVSLHSEPTVTRRDELRRQFRGRDGLEYCLLFQGGCRFRTWQGTQKAPSVREALTRYRERIERDIWVVYKPGKPTATVKIRYHWDERPWKIALFTYPSFEFRMTPGQPAKWELYEMSIG